ncbi:MAG: glycosyltransferase [Sphingobacteriales bacterium]|nr:glycosyltransferase [Sphingobacteriales bacterium]
MNSLDIISYLFCLSYISLVLLLFYGWLSVKKADKKVAGLFPDFSVIVPFRNEIANLPVIFESLMQQNYPKEHFEVIFIDDSSEDDGHNYLINKIKGSDAIRFKVLSLKDTALTGKKNALTKAIESAENEWIVTTDADCSMLAGWLSTIATYITDNQKLVMISGPVSYSDENSLFQKLQSLEFSALNGIGASMTRLGFPYLTNGANLIFRKSAFDQVGGYSGSESKTSGDDVFLTQKIARNFPGQISFLKNEEAMVTTKPTTNFKDFYHQRIRWTGKTFHTGIKGLALPFFVWLFHLTSLSFLVMSVFDISYLKFFFILIISKILAEAVFLFPVLKFYGKLRFILLLPVTGFLYIFYISILPFLSYRKSFIWKGRKVK